MAVVLTRSQGLGQPSAATHARTLLPSVVWSLVVTAVVFAWPACTTWLRSAPVTVNERVMAPDDVEKALREMSAPSRP